VQKRRSLIGIVAILLLLKILTSSLYSAEERPAYDFNLSDIFDESKVYSLDDFSGKVVIINLWASWCTGCKKEMPLFHVVQSKYDGKKVTFVAVNIDDNKKNALKFLKKLSKKMHTGLNFPVLYDKEKELAKKYNPRGLPVSYLIDRNGNIVRQFIGSFDDSNVTDLTMAIDRLIGDGK
jgi:thiol-disulfide isomerase/thioredoxin